MVAAATGAAAADLVAALEGAATDLRADLGAGVGRQVATAEGTEAAR